MSSDPRSQHESSKASVKQDLNIPRYKIIVQAALKGCGFLISGLRVSCFASPVAKPNLPGDYWRAGITGGDSISLIFNQIGQRKQLLSE